MTSHLMGTGVHLQTNKTELNTGCTYVYRYMAQYCTQYAQTFTGTRNSTEDSTQVGYTCVLQIHFGYAAHSVTSAVTQDIHQMLLLLATW
jgi:hypothetical protein